jgi:hypothetical protein
MASYSTMLLVHLLDSMLNCILGAYRSLIPKGETSMAAAPTQLPPKLRRNKPPIVFWAPRPLSWSRAPSILPQNLLKPVTLLHCTFDVDGTF